MYHNCYFKESYWLQYAPRIFVIVNVTLLLSMLSKLQYLNTDIYVREHAYPLAWLYVFATCVKACMSYLIEFLSRVKAYLQSLLLYAFLSFHLKFFDISDHFFTRTIFVTCDSCRASLKMIAHVSVGKSLYNLSVLTGFADKSWLAQSEAHSFCLSRICT